ncbi:MAG: hypothetical protein UU43_C0013G0008 [Candidatus Falkowbacteria bacterium GW2011_GWA2_41_14]|uniref:DUF5666 domain-containing protein n=1 Tax=Candidatus Falkowbacteria bacterium GW2011_GWA2_41_14 TaxID=1618635 RepID=A0A0G0XTJ5_9BACT|nr:MAG: hypothetical protein UU43_C0013G0008 [Candidatus Falkowbacteria bacterium GW2011_GWA2_41_14]
MTKKILPIFIIALIIIGGGAFYGGIKYAAKKNSGRQMQKFQPLGAGGGLKNNKPGGVGKGDLSTGEIIAKDDKSITIKLGDSGSKIIFYSNSTKIEKTIAGTATDLKIGKTIMTNGKANTDGSVTAQSIQMRPEISKEPIK